MNQRLTNVSAFFSNWRGIHYFRDILMKGDYFA